VLLKDIPLCFNPEQKVVLSTAAQGLGNEILFDILKATVFSLAGRFTTFSATLDICGKCYAIGLGGIRCPSDGNILGLTPRVAKPEFLQLRPRSDFFSTWH
jgi:hypothetical protein